MHQSARTAVSVALAVLGTGCDSQDAFPERVQGNVALIGSSTILTLGASESAGGTPPEMPVAAFRNGDRIVVAYRDDQEIRIYDLQGRLKSRLGGAGEGPGEFRDIVALTPLGDSIVAFDAALWRVSVFDPHGNFARSFRIDPIEFGRAIDMGLIGDSLNVVILSRGDPRTLAVGGVARDSLRVIRLPIRASGSVEDVLPTAAIAGSYWRREESVASVRVRRVLDGPEGLITFLDSMVIGNSSDSPALLVLRGIVWDTLFSARSGSARASRRREDGISESLVWSVTTRLEEIWLADVETTGDTLRSWRGLRLDGSMIGAMLLPYDFHPWQVGPDWVLGWRSDEDGAFSVELRDLLAANAVESRTAARR